MWIGVLLPHGTQAYPQADLHALDDNPQLGQGLHQHVTDVITQLAEPQDYSPTSDNSTQLQEAQGSAGENARVGETQIYLHDPVDCTQSREAQDSTDDSALLVGPRCYLQAREYSTQLPEAQGSADQSAQAGEIPSYLRVADQISQVRAAHHNPDENTRFDSDTATQLEKIQQCIQPNFSFRRADVPALPVDRSSVLCRSLFVEKDHPDAGIQFSQPQTCENYSGEPAKVPMLAADRVNELYELARQAFHDVELIELDLKWLHRSNTLISQSSTLLREFTKHLAEGKKPHVVGRYPVRHAQSQYQTQEEVLDHAQQLMIQFCETQMQAHAQRLLRIQERVTRGKETVGKLSQGLATMTPQNYHLYEHHHHSYDSEQLITPKMDRLRHGSSQPLQLTGKPATPMGWASPVSGEVDKATANSFGRARVKRRKRSASEGGNGNGE
ncbi:hypothetical protein IFR05_014829 [Cadophora sp. M221]|nr:hypothetical protein IFR05_014829 [Cadophora sp. M221]